MERQHRLTRQQVEAWAAARDPEATVGLTNATEQCPLATAACQILGLDYAAVEMDAIWDGDDEEVETDFNVTAVYQNVDRLATSLGVHDSVSAERFLAILREYA